MIIKTLLKKKYLRRIRGVKHEKFEKCVSKLKSAWRAAQKRKLIAGRPYGIGELREHLLLLLMYYRTYTTHLFLAQIFKVDEATICRTIKRIERFFVKNPSNSLKTFIFLQYCCKRVKLFEGLREAFFKKFLCEVVIAPSGRILRVSKLYKGRVHDFEIRKTEGLLPAVPILADSGYQDLQNTHSAAVILPKKKPKNGSLSASEQARNTKLARCRIAIEHTFAHLKKWNILAARYRGHLSNYPQIFQTIAGIYNLTRAR